MKLETPPAAEDSHELFVLTALFIGLGILMHRVFFLLALIFAFVGPVKRLLEHVAGSISHRRHL